MKTQELKPLDWFNLQEQARKELDQSTLLPLGLSLRVRQLQPVLTDLEGNVICGERRVRAARVVGLTQLMALITDEPLTDSDLMVMQVEENIHREGLKDYEKWMACTELLALNPEWEHKDLALHLHIDQSRVTHWLSPSRCIPDVQEALKSGKLTLSHTYQIAQADPIIQPELLKASLDGETRDSIHQRRKRAERASRPEVKCARIKADLRNGISVVASGPEMTLDQMADALVEVAKKARKAIAEKQDAKTFTAWCKNQANAVS